MAEYIKSNQQIWDNKVSDGDAHTIPVSSQDIEMARNGQWHILLTATKPVPRHWFPASLAGKKVLCLASGGGQQGPILAAAGADVTVYDISTGQLSQDNYVAARDKLTIKTVQGDMRDLSVFADESFDLIVHPWSNAYVDSVLKVWHEAYRILKRGGLLLSGFDNPIEYIFDNRAFANGELVVKYSIPYSDLTSIEKEELQELIIDKNIGVCFGHSLTDQIQGQIDAGFVIVGFYEDNCGGTNPLDQYIDVAIATKALKPA